MRSRTLFGFVLAATLALTGTAHAAPFSASSTTFKNNGALPESTMYSGFGCTGTNTSPAIEWKNAPAGTKSFAITMFDPDAPTGSGWWHWMVYNLPADTLSLAEGAVKGTTSTLPAGSVQGPTDFGVPGYGGPCPPPGPKHHYVFTIFALKVDKLDVPKGATSAAVSYFISSNALAKTKLTATFARK